MYILFGRALKKIVHKLRETGRETSKVTISLNLGGNRWRQKIPEVNVFQENNVHKGKLETVITERNWILKREYDRE